MSNDELRDMLESAVNLSEDGAELLTEYKHALRVKFELKRGEWPNNQPWSE